MPKPASLMIFLMLGDKAAYALFNIWKLPRLLRLYNTKVQLINFHNQNPHNQKFHTQKISLQPMSHHHKRKSMPHQNFTTIKIFSNVYTQLPNFSINIHKKFPHVQDSHKRIPTSSCTNKFSHS